MGFPDQVTFRAAIYTLLKCGHKHHFLVKVDGNSIQTTGLGIKCIATQAGKGHS